MFRKTKILFLIGDYGTGGKERQLTEIIKFLPKNIYSISLFMKCSTSYYYESIKNQLNSCFSLNKSNFNIFDIISLGQYLKNVNPDIVFTFSTTLGHFTMFLNFLRLDKYHLINGSIRDAPVMLNLQHRFEKFLYNFYADVVSNSHSGLKAFNQIDKQGRYILYNAFDMKRIPVGTKLDLRQKLGIDDKFIVVMVASMNSSKDQDSFICAAHRIIKKNYDIDILFYLIGNGPKKVYYEEKIKYLGINESVLFTGTIDNVEEYLKAANLSVLTSASYHGEGIPNVVLESLACGTPVIATDNGGTKEILLHNYNGYLIKNGDYKDLANKLIFLYNNPDVLKSFSGKGVETVKNHFSIEKMIVEFESIIAS